MSSCSVWSVAFGVRTMLTGHYMCWLVKPTKAHIVYTYVCVCVRLQVRTLPGKTCDVCTIKRRSDTHASFPFWIVYFYVHTIKITESFAQMKAKWTHTKWRLFAISADVHTHTHTQTHNFCRTKILLRIVSSAVFAHMENKRNETKRN